MKPLSVPGAMLWLAAAVAAICNRRSWVAGAMLWLAVSAADAHPILNNNLWIETTGECVTMRVEVTARELIVVQGLSQLEGGGVDLDSAIDLAPRHAPYLLDHLLFRADGVPLKGTVTRIRPPKEIGTGPEAPDMANFDYYIEFPLPPDTKVLTLSHNMVKEFPNAPGVPWNLSYTWHFGPHDAPPVSLGNLPLEQEVNFYLVPPEVADPRDAPPPEFAAEFAAFQSNRPHFSTANRWVFLWWAFLAAVLMGGAAMNGDRWLGWFCAISIGAWLAGYFGNLQRLRIADWLLAAPCGIGIILLSTDVIASGFSGRAVSRRRVIALVLAALYPAAQCAHIPALAHGGRLWNAGALVATALAGLLLWQVSSRLLRRTGSPGGRALVQALCLALTITGISLMLSAMGVRLTRLFFG